MLVLAPPVGAIEIIFEKLDEVLLELESHDKLFAAGVASIGEAAGYALIWEWGNARQVQAGEETCQGTNPDGSTVWLSVQAPFGYISINEPLYWAIVQEVLSEVKFAQTDPAAMTAEFEKAMFKIAKLIAPIIRDAAPFASGALRDSITALAPGDSLLDDSTAEDGALVASTEGRWQP
jgi:hypothetical protein